MPIANPARLVVPCLVALMLLAGVPAFAQVDFSGVWTANTNFEDGPERVQGPSLVEFVGLPINDQGRQWGLAYRPSRLSLPLEAPSYRATPSRAQRMSTKPRRSQVAARPG